METVIVGLLKARSPILTDRVSQICQKTVVWNSGFHSHPVWYIIWCFSFYSLIISHHFNLHHTCQFVKYYMRNMGTFMTLSGPDIYSVLLSGDTLCSVLILWLYCQHNRAITFAKLLNPSWRLFLAAWLPMLDGKNEILVDFNWTFFPLIHQLWLFAWK